MIPIPSRSPAARALAKAALGLALGAAAFAQPALPTTRDKVRGVDHPEENAFEVVVGPVSLPAGLPHVRLPIEMIPLPFEGWLHGFSWKITDAAGRKLPDELLHHVNLIDPDRRELFSPMARRVMAAGRETAEQSMPRILGYPIDKGTRLMVASMFANPTLSDIPEAYLHVRLEYTRKGEGFIAPRDVYPFYLDVMGPVGVKDFEVPPGRTVKSWEGTPAIDAWILGAGGHLHDYGVELRLEDVTDGSKVLVRLEPKTENGRHVTTVPTSQLWWKGGVKILKSHRYRVVTVYDNPTDKPAPHGGMGVIAGIVLAPDADWPPLDRGDPTYVADVQGTLNAPRKNQGHAGHAH